MVQSHDIDKGNSKQARSIWNVNIQKNDEDIYGLSTKTMKKL